MRTAVKNYKLYNQAKIARTIGKSRSYVSRVKRGKVKNERVLIEILKIIKGDKAA